MSEPFTMVYDKMAAAFKAQHRNVVNYDSIHAPKKDVLTNKDLPELTLVPDSAVVRLGNSSCGTDVTKTYQVMVKTGKQRLNESTFPVMWNLLKVYHALCFGSALETLEFNERRFVTNTTAGTATFSLGAMERGVYGWSCLWPITVEMHFEAGDLEL